MQTQIDTYTFTCPECAALLRVPQNKAGISGPCPSCQNVISSPNKLKKNPDVRDIETKLDEPCEIIRKPLSSVEKRSTTKQEKEKIKNEIQTKKRVSPHNALVYTASIIIISLSAFVGFKVLTGEENLVEKTQLEKKGLIEDTPNPVDSLPINESTTIVEETTNEKPITIDAAKISLEKFLSAETISDKARYILNAERLLPKIIEYHENRPAFEESLIDQKATNQNLDSQFRIFYVTTKKQKISFPVFLENTDRGWKVNWEAFIQYNDNSLGNFLQEFQQKGKNFYVKLERSHYFGSKIPELGSKICFKIDPIVSGQAYVFSERKSDMAEYADTELQWEEVYYPIVRLEWDNGNPTKPFVKIVEIVQKNWLSPDNQRATLSSTKSN